MRSEIILTHRSPEKNDGQYRYWSEIWQETVGQESHSYFLSWPWLSHWLKNLPAEVDIFFVQLEHEGGRAVCFLGHKKEKRHFFINSNSFYLHYTGQSPYDDLTLEYNQLPGYGQGSGMLSSLLLALPNGWDEFHLPALDATRFPAFLLEGKLTGYQVLTKYKSASHFVDLSKVRNSVSYLALLSRNTRGHIRRAKKKLAQMGTLRLEAANDQTAALKMFADMVEMHQYNWQQRGLHGAFNNPWFNEFHRSLIGCRFETGEIQLLRILCGDETVGCLYNFVYKGVVHYYQSGFNYKKFGELKPGLVSHAMTIPYNAKLGHKIYDFLAGDSQYKKSLSTDANQLVWCCIQKPRLRFKIENLAKSAKAWIRGRKSRKH
jgi:hypothetical protein